jgi:hypothetical protein
VLVMCGNLFYEPIPQPCERCGGDGGFDVPHDIDRRDGSLMTHWVECTACGGTGDGAPLEMLPLELEDLDYLDAAGALVGNPVERENDHGKCKL